MQPFLDVSVIPSYGKFSALITWTVLQEFKAGRFSIWKSPDGVNDWSEIGFVEGSNHFEDTALITGGKFVETYYRIILQFKGARYDSAVASTFGQVSRQEFATARYIINLEYKDLQQRTPVFIFKQKVTAPDCPTCTDSTGQSIGISLCETCFGTGFDGGYWRPPTASFMRVTNISPKMQNNSQEGVGAEDPVYFKIRTLAFPGLDADDMIVDPKSDRRFLVEQSDVAYLNGKVPTVTNASLVLLRRTDVRYKLPIR